MPITSNDRGRLFARRSWPETARIGDILRKETLGGALLLVAALAALVWANSPWSAAYESLRDARIGPSALHLDLSLGTWAADGLLAVFFFVAGLELKREFVSGDLRDPRHAALPVAAALGGVIVPAVLYAVINSAPGGDGRGWAIPTATDIAFALAVLAVVGSRLPPALRIFLLTLAVVDDLIAIVIIAIFYTHGFSAVHLLLAMVPLAVFTLLVQRGVDRWWLLLPIAAATWLLIHESGVHATVAGVLLAFAVPVPEWTHPSPLGLAEHFEHRFRPFSAAFAVPVFAFFAAGVTIGGAAGLRDSLSDRVSIGIVLGLVVGKPLGIFGATWLVSRFTRASLDSGLAWLDVAGLAILAGIGFTVSLLIGELAFGESDRSDNVKVAVLLGSGLAAVIASVILRARSRVYARIADEESRDVNRDGVPDVYAPPA